VGFLDLFGRRGERDPADEPEPARDLDESAVRRRVVVAYHERSKHDVHRFAAGPHELDWDTQPDPFRRWTGARRIPLDLAPTSRDVVRTGSESPGPSRSGGVFVGPAFRTALARDGVATAALDRFALARFFRDSLAISAWKQIETTRWALRVNPSSGNLHPTEAYAILPPIEGLCPSAVVAHYAPREHELEVRLELSGEPERRLLAITPPGSFWVVLTSIHWREAWKYGERAYRYVQHDVGHAIGALSVAASASGWTVELVDEPATTELQDALGLHASSGASTGPETEHADVLLLVRPTGTARETGDAWPRSTTHAWSELAWRGHAEALSPDHVEWNAIEAVAHACAKPRTPAADPTWTRLPPPPVVEPGSPLRDLVQRRRSAQSLDGRTGIRADEFFRVLESTMPRRGRAPFDALPWSPHAHLAIFVHRVDGLHPGLYWLQRDPERAAEVRRSLRAEFLWERPPGCPSDLPLDLLLPLDLRRHAVGVSCQQDIAGDGAFSLGMVVEFERGLDTFGAWFYPRLFWETGVIGQVLYLEAEAIGRRGTGIGCFLDDPMHTILGIRGRGLQSLYHFTVGQPIEDTRLTTLPPYPDRAP